PNNPCESFEERPLSRADDGLGVLLPLQFETVVYVAVKVNCELRDPCDRARSYQALFATREQKSAGHGEVTIQPGVQKRATINLYANLCPSFDRPIRVGFDAKTGRIGVAPN